MATARVENVEAGAPTVVAQGTGPAVRFAQTERPPKPQLSLLPLVVPAPAEPAPEPPTVAAAPVAPAEPAVTVPPGPAPAPDPPPEPEPVSSPVSSGSVEDAIAAWFPDLYDEAYEVAVCESTLNPGAASPGGGNHGLFQINTVHRHAFEAVTGVEFYSGVYDPYLNAQFARHLHDESGWAPWACAP